MGLLFGNLTRDFINFQTAAAFAVDPNNATAQAQLPIAQENFKHTAALDASYLVYIGRYFCAQESFVLHLLILPVLLGVGTLACTFIYMYAWAYTGEINAKRLRENYLRAVLRQDIAYFDDVGAGEVTTHIQTNTRMLLYKHLHLFHSRVYSRLHRSGSAGNV